MCDFILAEKGASLDDSQDKDQELSEKETVKRRPGPKSKTNAASQVYNRYNFIFLG